MAITRAQIVRQLYRYGGDTMGGPNDRSNPGQGSGAQGPAGGASAGGNYGGNRNPEQTYGAGDRNPGLETNIDRGVAAELNRENRERMIEEYNKTLAINDLKNKQKNTQKLDILKDLYEDDEEDVVDQSSFLDKAKGIFSKTIPGKVLDFLNDPRFGKTTADNIEYRYGYGPDYQGTNTKSSINNNNQTGGDGGTNPFILPQYMMPVPSITEPEEELTELQRMLRDRGDIARRFKADGGIMNTDVVGGEFDFESARQMYGLGKLVKKATRAVKKVASSPIGKAALLYAGTAGLGALGAGAARAGTGFGIFAPSNVLSNLTASKALFTNKILGDAVGPNATRVGGLFSKFPGGGVGAAITAASVLPFLGIGTGDESEEEAQAILDQSGIDIAAIRNNPEQYLARRFRAEGGPAEGKEPVAKKVMPLLDMNGMEKDYRETGGFVPIGRMEKADDVPARLSKNEFVFTADAVRNAGDGDIDKGAEVMYNMMKHLEDGGDVSEESQGLEGARNMFQTSQRLEEVL
jgi:hypothetical protein